jgi:hypothetical protein
MATRIQVRRDLKANWSSSLVLASGEVAYETDTGNLKVGDGSTQWSSLDYVAIANLSSAQTDANHSEYRKQGRFYLNTPSGSWTNLPSDMTAGDGESVLLVTRHMESSTAWFLQQLTQFVTSGSATKSWVRVYDSGASSYSAWQSTAHISPNEVVTASINNLAVTTAKIDDLAVATGKIADNAITDAKIRDSAAVSVIGRSANSSGDPADIAAASNDTLFRRVSDTLSFGQLTNGMLPTNTVGLDKLVNMAASGLLGNTAAGAVTALTPAQVYAQINNSGFVHTDNTKVGCIGFVWITSTSTVNEYPSGSFAVGTSGGTRYLRSASGTWTVLWASVNASGNISSGLVNQITTTSTNVVIGVNALFAVGVRTA